MSEEQVTSPDLQPEDCRNEISLRPRTLDEFIGQDQLKENLKVFINAAKKRGESLDHVLLYGPPGLGKTTLANIIANELNVNIKATSAPVIERPGDLAAILTSISVLDCLFIDEIHRFHPATEEILYPAMEDSKIDIVVGQGPSAKSIKISLQKFTLIGATTRAGLITSPLRARFGIVSRLDFYPLRDMEKIVRRSAKLLAVPVDESSVSEIAKRSRGTPRIANRLLRRLRDFAQIKGDGAINMQIAKDALIQLEVDEYGLDMLDRKLLETIIEKYGGGPVGLDTLSASIGEDSGTIEDLSEPYLMQIGFIKRTSRGRMATELAYKHLNIVDNKKPQTLF